MVLWLLLASAAIGYLLGNFQTGLVVGWASRKIDLRMHGSGGTGATNALRTLGKGGALLIYYLVRDLLAEGVNFHFAIAMNSDEERGSKYSRPYFEELAQRSKTCFIFEPGRGLGTDNTTPVASLAWTDAAGDHETDDLLSNPPIADID